MSPKKPLYGPLDLEQSSSVAFPLGLRQEQQQHTIASPLGLRRVQKTPLSIDFSLGLRRAQQTL